MRVFNDGRTGKNGTVYNIPCYIVDITEEMRNQALSFSEEIIRRDNQYDRLLPKKIRECGDEELKKKFRIQRTYIGKLGELAFKAYLEEKGKTVNTDDMFVIYEGQENVDEFDFVTTDNKSVDIKTGYLENHKRLMVNCEQFLNNRKDYYVGIKLATTTERVVFGNVLVDFNNITSATIYGYCDYEFLNRQETRDFGEGPAKARFYNALMGIDKLLEKF